MVELDWFGLVLKSEQVAGLNNKKSRMKGISFSSFFANFLLVKINEKHFVCQKDIESKKF